MLHLGSFGSKLTTSLLGSVSGEQIFEIFGVYVESSLMGYGSCCYHGHCPCQWRSKYPPLSFFLSFFLSFLPSNSHKFLLWKYDCVAIFFKLCIVNSLQGKPPDWQDFVGIITLLLINSTISFIEENNAGNAAAALMARLAPKAKVLDDL